MKERLIWRPNSIPQEEWDKLSRDEQIQWWKEKKRSSERSAPPGPLRIFHHYQQGLLTRHEFSWLVFKKMTVEIVKELLSEECPEELLRNLDELSSELPADNDEEGWSNQHLIFGGTWAPWMTTEDIHRAMEEMESGFREGVRLFRMVKPQSCS